MRLTERSGEVVYWAPWDLVIQAYQERFHVIPNPRFGSLAGTQMSNLCFQSSDRRCVSWILQIAIRPLVPAWLLKLIGLETVLFSTENIVDHNCKTMTIRVQNKSLRALFEVEE